MPPPSSSSSSRRQRLVKIVAGLVLLLGALIYVEPSPPTERAKISDTSAKKSPAAPSSSPSAANSVPTALPPLPSAPDVALSAPAPAPAPTLSPGGSAAITPPDDILRTVTENSVPGRMMFLDFVLDQEGLRLTGATGAEGRAKSLGPRTGFGFIQFEVFDASGRLALTGSVEDPTRRRLEYPAGTPDGKIASTVQFADGGPLAVRLPGEIVPARIVFYRDRNPMMPSSPAREALGEFVLRPSR